MNSRVVFDSVGSQGTCNAEQQFPWCSARCTAIQLQAVHSPWEIRFTSHLGPSSQERWVLAPTFKSLGGPHSNHSQVYVWLVKPSHGELVPLFKACPATPSCFLSLSWFPAQPRLLKVDQKREGNSEKPSLDLEL